MDFEKAWSDALKSTEIVRPRIKSLMTFEDTRVPYILLSESDVDHNDTVVRRGEVMVQKPALILPPNIPQFLGFDFEEKEDTVINFLLVRGISLPSLKYDNKTHSLDIHEGKLSEAIKFYQEELSRQESTSTGLVTGPSALWQFSILIYTCSQAARSAESDFKKLYEHYKRNPKKD